MKAALSLSIGVGDVFVSGSEAERKGPSAGVVRRVLWTEGWERRVRMVLERRVEVRVGMVARRREGWSRIRMVLFGEVWSRADVMVCSREERGFEVGEFLVVGDREADSMSTKWKVGVREMSRPYVTFAYQRTAFVDADARFLCIFCYWVLLLWYDFHLPLLFGARLSKRRGRASSLRGLRRWDLRHRSRRRWRSAR